VQTAVAVALAVFYVGASLLLGGVPPRNGFPLWFFGPAALSACGGLIAARIASALPIPWEQGQPQRLPPRRVHLSWRAALRVPAFLPVLVILSSMFMMVRLHLDIDWVLYAVVPLVALVLAVIARKRRREVRLLRDGAVALAVVEERQVCEWPDEIVYLFVTRDGTPVRGRAHDLDYDVPVGARVPVYHAAGNPRDHVVATACWFEAE